MNAPGEPEKLNLADNRPLSADELLPLVYHQLRSLAQAKLRSERPGQTLYPTDLVHEAVIKLLRADPHRTWHSTSDFVATAAHAMRCILIDRARRKATARRGGNLARQAVRDDLVLQQKQNGVDLLVVDEALERLEERYPDRATLIKLRIFAGLSLRESAALLGVSLSTAKRQWTIARAYLVKEMRE